MNEQFKSTIKEGIMQLSRSDRYRERVSGTHGNREKINRRDRYSQRNRIDGNRDIVGRMNK